MSFTTYLNEAAEDSEIELDAFVEKIKKNGLYGYDVFKHIKEDELKKILDDDNYFESKMKASDDKDAKLEEMVLRPKDENSEEEEEPKKPFNTQQKKLSLAVRLGLKKENPDDKEESEENNKKAPNVLSTGGSSLSKQPEKETPLSFADRMRADIERRRAEREERLAKEKEIRDARAKEAEDEAKERQAPLSFNGKDMTDQSDKDAKVNDKTNDELDKKLTNHMFKRTRASTEADDDGYKRVRNLGSISDKAAADKLQKAMDKKFPKPNEDGYVKDTQTKQLVKKRTNTEYSKRTLLAIADRMDFTVFCKFRKLNGQLRTGNFQIGKTESQVTQKQNTIIVQDLDLSKQENKVVWRTINLDKIIQIVPT